MLFAILIGIGCMVAGGCGSILLRRWARTRLSLIWVPLMAGGALVAGLVPSLLRQIDVVERFHEALFDAITETRMDSLSSTMSTVTQVGSSPAPASWPW